jgi:uncharacterized protein YjbJ (UPF0337 family)
LRAIQPRASATPHAASGFHAQQQLPITQGVSSMNKDQAKGRAKQVSGEIKDQVGKATDSTKTQAKGKMEKAAGKVQETYGNVKEKLSR